MRKKYLFIMLLFVCFFQAFTENYLPPSGPWWGGEDMDGDAELMMVDVMVPEDGNFITTYWSTINFYIGPRGGYLGIQNNLGRPLNNIFSIWDLKEGAGECSYAWKAPTTVVDGFGGEGTGIHTHNDMGWVPGQWYTTLIRRWYVGGDSTFLGFWMYDFTNTEWTHYVSLVTPEKDAKLKGNIGGFVENFWKENGLDERTGYFRRPWKYTEDGTWIKPKKFSATANWKETKGWDAESFGTDAIFVKACGPNIASSSSLTFPYQTAFDRSPLATEAGELDSVYMVYDQPLKQLKVYWEYNKAKPLQLAYKLSLRSSGQGVPIHIDIDTIDPGTRSIVIDLPDSIQRYTGFTARVEAVDIFDNAVAPKSGDYTVGVDSVSTAYIIDGNTFSVVDFSSETEPVINAIDGDETTFWHSQWQPSTIPMPHTLTFRVDSMVDISAVRLLNRQNHSNGYFKDITIKAGHDGSSWSVSKDFVMPRTGSWVKLPFEAKDLSYLRIIIKSNYAGDDIASLAELQLIANEKLDDNGSVLISNEIATVNSQITLNRAGDRVFTLNLPIHGDYNLKLSSLNGQVVYAQQLRVRQARNVDLDLSKLAQRVLILTVSSERVNYLTKLINE